jgi:membrane associated rhomboid family serine protease
MIPHRITGRSDFRAYSTFALLVITVGFFGWEVLMAMHHRAPITEDFLKQYALVTCEVSQQPLSETIIDGVRGIFLHTTFTTFLTNIIFLWVFGSSVEKYFGHKRFMAFYLIAGFGGHILSILFNQGTCLPLIGPAGAIAGVMGAFLWLYPARRIETFVPFLARKFDLPALFFVGLYFALSIFVLDAGPLSGQFQPFWDEAGGFMTGLGIIFVGTMLKPAPRGDPFEYLDKSN